MHAAEEHVLRSDTRALVLDWALNRRPPITGEDPTHLPPAIVAAHVVADEARLNLQRWVDAGRRAGLSWSEVGEALGISKQAAQQRFRGEEPEVGTDEQVVRIGATAFNEAAMLEEEGAKGNELMRTAALKLVFRRTDRPWENVRTVFSTPPGDSWELVDRWGPFAYWKRPRPS